MNTLLQQSLLPPIALRATYWVLGEDSINTIRAANTSITNLYHSYRLYILSATMILSLAMLADTSQGLSNSNTILIGAATLSFLITKLVPSYYMVSSSLSILNPELSFKKNRYHCYCPISCIWFKQFKS